MTAGNPGQRRADPDLQKTTEQSLLVLYPNPAQDRLTAELPTGLMWEQDDVLIIQNTSGVELCRTIPGGTAGGSCHFDTGGYPTGVYILRWLRNDLIQVTQRFAVVHE
jgi:hypothetical protein